MQILLVGTSLARTSAGGSSYLLGLARTLELTGHQLTIAAPPGAFALIGRSAPRAQLLRVRPVGGLMRVARDLVCTRFWATRVQADVVVYPHEFAPPTPVPVVIVVQNVGAFHPLSIRELGMRGRALRALSGWTSNGAAVVVSVSHRASVIWQESVGTTGRTVVIPEAFLLDEEFAEADPPISLSAGGRPSVVIVAPAAARYKDLAGVERALGVTMQNAPGLLESLDVRVIGARHKIPGVDSVCALPRNQLLATFRRAALVVFPSRVESFGLPAFEAASQGARPAVLADTPMADLLHDRCLPMGSTVSDLPALLQNVAGGISYRLDDDSIDRVRGEFSPESASSAWGALLESIAVGSERG